MNLTHPQELSVVVLDVGATDMMQHLDRAKQALEAYILSKVATRRGELQPVQRA